MKLKQLLKVLPKETKVKGPVEIDITGICASSKRLSPGNLFIARRGLKTHGACYLKEAVASGAAAFLTDLYDPSFQQVTQLIVPNPQDFEGGLASTFYHHPSEKMVMVGITGTNGKTTTAYLVKQLFDSLVGPTGLIGTIEYCVGRQSYPATHTTPDASTNQRLLKEMLLSHCKAAVMEVTSHALEQGRTSNISYDFAIFTNLSEEHLDYHQTMEAYCEAKAKLFTSLGNSSKRGVAILNNDSPWSEKVSHGYRGKKLTFGLNGGDLTASNIETSASCMRFTINYENKHVQTSLPLVGTYNIYNALAAIAPVLLSGIPLEEIAKKLPTLSPIPGRLEAVSNHLGIHLYVDFAHTPDALEKALLALKGLQTGKIITVFGCGGDRDRKKRPLMAQVSEKYSTFTIITNDNPRSEDPEAIAKEVLSGFSNKDAATVELKREAAIQKAIEYASSGDIVLIAGKGHEKTQTFAHQTLPFDDCLIAAHLLSNLKPNM